LFIGKCILGHNPHRCRFCNISVLRTWNPGFNPVSLADHFSSIPHSLYTVDTILSHISPQPLHSQFIIGHSTIRRHVVRDVHRIVKKE